jgi:hypothetical protein
MRLREVGAERASGWRKEGGRARLREDGAERCEAGGFELCAAVFGSVVDGGGRNHDRRAVARRRLP